MAGAPSGDITALLGRIRDGDGEARDALVPLVYRELEAIARAYARPGASLEPRGLIHELYLRLAAAPLDARDRKHFYAVAALAMRQILIDRARRQRAAKRGGGELRVTLPEVPSPDDGLELAAVTEALRELEARSPRQARIAELRTLVGLTVAETAEAIGVSERTVAAEWRLARAWLVRALRGEGAAE